MLFLSFTDKFADIALKNSMYGISLKMSRELYVADNGVVTLDDSKVKLNWGFDALYSNLAFRLIDKDSNNIVLQSAAKGTQGFLFNGIVKNIPLSHSRLSESQTSLYRMEVTLANKNYFLDVARSDLLAELASAGIKPAIVKVAILIISAAFILFLFVSFLAIKLIIKPANALSRQIKTIRAEDLQQRLAVNSVPKELMPIALAMNDALDRVESSFEQQKRFIADAAHELRTPLAILLNRLELKMSASTTKTALINDGQYLARIVEQLLDLSRAQNNHERHIAIINMQSVIKNVIAHLAPMAIDKEQELALIVNNDTENGTCMLNIDEGDFTVIVKNLVENAIKHSPSKASINVTIHKHGFTVEDSGIGIAEQYQQIIFERFWRENQSDRSGSGLGLAIIKELLSHYDAEIFIRKSASLGGAMFEVNFPNNSITCSLS